MTDDDRQTEVSTSERMGDVRRVLADRYTIVVVTLVVLALVGGAFTATTIAGSGDAEQEEGTTWSDSGEFTHSAIVQNDTGVFEQGDELRDRGTYFTRATPELDVAYEYRLDTENASADVETELLLILQSVGDDEVYWELTEPLDSQQSDSLATGESHAVGATVDVVEIEERFAAIEDDLGASPGDTEARIVARSEIDGTVGTESVTHHREDVLVISPDGDTYGVDAQLEQRPSGQQVEGVAQTGDDGWFQAVGAPLVATVSLLGLVGVVLARKRGYLDVSADTRHRADRERFDDWITVGALPAALTDQPRIDVDSLEGLVDVAIDSGRRVIEDTNDNCYYVTDGPLLYRYEPPVGTVVGEDESDEPTDGADAPE
ncbi:DUF5305 domain-containing protein [Natranaeroarchaeum sulfidigenes]|uniref:Putative membrane protein n=1 Tax=Natranaeroarchaeum sulfidigenes TaxID=2784880 RepID=A0A897MV32_9EURY|nr:DUF5305 domain-containing protein [Natranaeroarchaeum sulfidigenes]QSG03878.1 putative membrane protein [Natranaeroarchaeum sulfidigenes]